MGDGDRPVGPGVGGPPPHGRHPRRLLRGHARVGLGCWVPRTSCCGCPPCSRSRASAGLTARLGTRLATPAVGLLSGLRVRRPPRNISVRPGGAPYALVVFAAVLSSFALVHGCWTAGVGRLLAYAWRPGCSDCYTRSPCCSSRRTPWSRSPSGRSVIRAGWSRRGWHGAGAAGAVPRQSADGAGGLDRDADLEQSHCYPAILLGDRGRRWHGARAGDVSPSPLAIRPSSTRAGRSCRRSACSRLPANRPVATPVSPVHRAGLGAAGPGPPSGGSGSSAGLSDWPSWRPSALPLR